MKVVFLEDVPNVATAGEMKEVAPGYARNFLIPKKLATAVTPANLAVIEAQVKARARIEARTDAEVADLAKVLEGKELVFRVKTGGKDRMYGSITSADIAAELAKDALLIDKRKIELPDPIKSLGSYEVPVALSAELQPKIKVNVVKTAPVEAK